MLRNYLTPLLLLLAVLLCSGCELGLPGGADPFWELNWTDMGDQPKLKPQREDLFSERVVGMLAPAEGTVATSQHPYRFIQQEADLAGETLVNPLSPTPEVLAKGQFVFENACIVCHGKQGAGDGEVAQLFPKPPHLMRQKVRNYSDGRIFHVPMRGQASMPSYSKIFEPEELWAVVHYVRKLQKESPVAPPTEADLAELAAKQKAEQEAEKESAEDTMNQPENTTTDEQP